RAAMMSPRRAAASEESDTQCEPREQLASHTPPPGRRIGTIKVGADHGARTRGCQTLLRDPARGHLRPFLSPPRGRDTRAVSARRDPRPAYPLRLECADLGPDHFEGAPMLHRMMT